MGNRFGPNGIGVWNARACFENPPACCENVLLHICRICVSKTEAEPKGKSKEIFEERFLQEVALAEGGEAELGSITWSINTGTP